MGRTLPPLPLGSVAAAANAAAEELYLTTRDVPCVVLFLAAMGLPAHLLPPVCSVLMTQ